MNEWYYILVEAAEDERNAGYIGAGMRGWCSIAIHATLFWTSAPSSLVATCYHGRTDPGKAIERLPKVHPPSELL